MRLWSILPAASAKVTVSSRSVLPAFRSVWRHWKAAMRAARVRAQILSALAPASISSYRVRTSACCAAHHSVSVGEKGGAERRRGWLSRGLPLQGRGPGQGRLRALPFWALVAAHPVPLAGGHDALEFVLKVAHVATTGILSMEEASPQSLSSSSHILARTNCYQSERVVLPAPVQIPGFAARSVAAAGWREDSRAESPSRCASPSNCGRAR
jgi:hypothetical protein